MEIFLDAPSPLGEQALAGCHGNQRLSALCERVFGKKCQTDLPDSWNGNALSLWIKGCFPLLTSHDLEWLSNQSHPGKAIWCGSKNSANAGVLLLGAGLQAPVVLGPEALNDQYGDQFERAKVPGDNWYALTSASDLSYCSQVLFRRNMQAAASAGVHFLAPDQVWIESNVHLEPGVVIGPSVYLGSGTSIGSGSLIQMGCHLKKAKLGSGVLLKPYSVVEESVLEKGAQVGPFAHIRPGTVLGPDTKVGNFVETKKATLGKASKASHLSYLGDVTVGEDCNIGAGTITCNYDGFNKWQTKLGDRVFIGSDSQLVAPVNIGDDAFVAAGSTVTKDVPSDALAISRSKQANKDGRAKMLRERAKAAKSKK